MDQNLARIVRRHLQQRGVGSLDDLTHDQQERIASLLGMTMPSLHDGLRESLAEERRQEIAHMRRGGRREIARSNARTHRRAAGFPAGTNVSVRGGVATAGDVTAELPADPEGVRGALHALAVSLVWQASRRAQRGETKRADASLASAAEVAAAADGPLGVSTIS